MIASFDLLNVKFLTPLLVSDVTFLKRGHSICESAVEYISMPVDRTSVASIRQAVVVVALMRFSMGAKQQPVFLPHVFS